MRSIGPRGPYIARWIDVGRGTSEAWPGLQGTTERPPLGDTADRERSRVSLPQQRVFYRETGASRPGRFRGVPLVPGPVGSWQCEGVPIGASWHCLTSAEQRTVNEEPGLGRPGGFREVPPGSSVNGRSGQAWSETVTEHPLACGAPGQ